MTECNAPRFQDLLPDYMAGSLCESDLAELRQHLAECASCTSDLAILRQVRALRVPATTLNAAAVSRIVAALPRPGSTAAGHGSNEVQVHPSRPMLVRTTSDMQAPPSTRSRSRRLQRHTATFWRVAATIVVMVAGGTSLLVAKRHDALPESLTATALAGAEPGSALMTESLGMAANLGDVLASATDVPVSYGDIGDYSEDELEAMLDRLDQWDGANSPEPLPRAGMLGTYRVRQ